MHSPIRKDSMSFLGARNFLLRHRDDYDTAYRDFRPPELHAFNWALDYFDAMASRHHRIALHAVDDEGDSTHLTFAAMRERAYQVPHVLRSARCRRGRAAL